MKKAVGVKKTDDFFLIFEENIGPINVFIACQTQWNRSANGRVQSLNYVALESTMRMMKIEDTEAIFADMRSMECAVIEEMNRGGR